MEKKLPQNIEAEYGLLGSLILDPSAYDEIIDILTEQDFYRESHQIIYRIFLLLVNQRIPADFITLTHELERMDLLENIGGSSYIADLVNQVPTSGNVRYYAEIVARCAIQRRLIHAGSQIVTLAYGTDANALEQAEQLLYDIRKANASSSFTSMPVLMNAYMEELSYLHSHRGEFLGVPTGYTDLDNALGGLQKSDLILLGARPSMGKTSLSLCIGYNAALRGKKVAVFSLEMGKRLLARRLMSMQSKVDMQRLRGGWIEDDEWEKIEASYTNLSQLPIWINDTAGNPVASMRSQLRRLAQQQGPADLVIVDYIGLIEPDVESSKRENLVQQVSAISRGLKALAREFDLPVLALCQLSRGVESRQIKRPQMSDLRDSGSLEQDADVVLFIYREDYYNKGVKDYTPTYVADVIIEKHRNGPTGVISLFFQEEQTMFYPLERSWEA